MNSSGVFCALSHRFLGSSETGPFSRGTWLGRCNTWCRGSGLPRDIGISPFTTALLMHGDIGHTLNDSRFPLDLELGLIEGSGRLPTGEGWKAVLNGRPLMPATKLKTGWSPTEPSRVRVSGGDRNVGQHRGWVETW